MGKSIVAIDGNTAAAHVAHATNEVIAIYPITPSSPMGELADEYSASKRRNIWGTVPVVVEMQSEAGAAGAVHGALTTGGLTTTFTASQGLLLMIPNMFKIAGELTPTVFHIAARAVACQALSIFGDHSDVMAARSTGFAMLASGSVQEVMDFALIAQAATLESRVPFLHFFEGFRVSHEIQKVEELDFDQMRAMIDENLVVAHRQRALNPERPTIRGTAQNPDVFFAARESANKYYSATPGAVQEAMEKFAAIGGRHYRLFDYVGAPDAERIIVVMGCGAETVEETVRHLTDKGEKVGLVKVRLFRPFSVEHFVAVIPDTVSAIAVLDRTKEPGAIGEPLYEDVRTAVGEAVDSDTIRLRDYPRIVGGRYGLGSNEFNAGMAKAVLDNLKDETPKNHFTIGVHDDVTFTSLEWDDDFSAEPPGVHRALFYGLGGDGTVGANKDSIKIIGKATDNFAQGYFVYDSKKSGAMTVSHLRFGAQPIKSPYLINKASFLACHRYNFVEKFDMLGDLQEGGVFLLASPYPGDEVWGHLPVEVQQQIIDRKLQFYVIDAVKIADEVGLGARINTTMMTAFFVISGVLPPEEALELIRKAIADTYGRKGQNIVDMNMRAVHMAKDRIERVEYPLAVSGNLRMKPAVPAESPRFVLDVTSKMIEGKGDQIPVSKLPDDGTYPAGTTKYEKRNVAEDIPVWLPEVCIQCGTCSYVCPHASIRIRVYGSQGLKDSPPSFKSTDARGKEFQGLKFSVQVAPEDCTGCGLCVQACPAAEKKDGKKTGRHAIHMHPQAPLREQEAQNYAFFDDLPDPGPSLVKRQTIKGSQLLRPMFEFSGACPGCGETPYVKLMSQLFGDRATIANATGCSSIYGGNLPTTPYTPRRDGRGPVWSNSLFEDAAEFGMGMRLTSDKLMQYARERVQGLLDSGDPVIDRQLLQAVLAERQDTQESIEQQRQHVGQLKRKLSELDTSEAKSLCAVADCLIKRSVWVLGGDGWAYDIGYGGLDHVIASGPNVNILVLDTEVYSNTGGQMSKATPVGAIAKFASGGKPTRKKDLGLMAISYGNVYVARVAMGANPLQTLRALSEAEAYEGPSLIIAYSHCIAHGYDLTAGLEHQKAAVSSGAWTLFRYNPQLAEEGKNPMTLDSKEPTTSIEDYMYSEIRFRSLRQSSPERARELLEHARRDARARYRQYKYLSESEMPE